MAIESASLLRRGNGFSWLAAKREKDFSPFSLGERIKHRQSAWHIQFGRVMGSFTTAGYDADAHKTRNVAE